MKTSTVQLALLVLAAISLPIKSQNDNTYVTNLSSRSIRATTIYHFGGHSDFIDRLIPPNTYQGDVYEQEACDLTNGGQWPLAIQAWVDGSNDKPLVNVTCDQSIVAFDNSDKSGVDVYDAVYGTLRQPTGSVLITLYP